MTDNHFPCPDRAVALGALADGELDAMAALALEDHLRTCPGCRTELARIGALRDILAAPDLRHTAPVGLRQRIVDATGGGRANPAAPRLPRVKPWLGGGAIGALAASLALLVTVPGLRAPDLTDSLVDGQIRSLQLGHLVDVVTSDRHTVKPWFNGRVTYAPPVVDLKDAGFPLVGGRLDVVARENVAVLVYRRRLHTINLFIRPAPSMAASALGDKHKAGYNLVGWTAGGLEYWAVSDVDADELKRFHRSFSMATEP